MSQNVNVNLVPGNYPKEFHVSQYDVGRQLVANIVDSTGAYSIPSGATVTLVGTKPSGFGFTLSGSVGSGGVVTFSTTATVTAEYGRIPCELRITSGDTVLGTANLMLIVEESPHQEGVIDGNSETVVPELTILVERVEAAASNVLDMQVEADTLPAGSSATYSYNEETNTATFGIPQGEAGAGAAGVVASAYSASSTYAVGDYVIHDGNLYRCTTAITTAEAFTAAHWTQFVLGDDVSDLKSDLNNTSKGVEDFGQRYNFVVGGLLNGNLTGATNRVSSSSIMSYDYDIFVTAETGFRFSVHTFENGVFTSDSGLSTNPMRIKAGTTFKVCIARVTEITETASVPYFVQQITFQTEMQDAVNVHSDVSGIVLNGQYEPNILWATGAYNYSRGNPLTPISNSKRARTVAVDIKQGTVINVSFTSGYKVAIYHLTSEGNYISESGMITASPATAIALGGQFALVVGKTSEANISVAEAESNFSVSCSFSHFPFAESNVYAMQWGKNYIGEISDKTKNRDGIYGKLNSDNSITFNGTATDTTDYFILGTNAKANTDLPLIQGQGYVLSFGCGPKTGVNARLICAGGTDTTAPLGNDIPFVMGSSIKLMIRFSNGVTVSDYTVYPMIRNAGLSDSYEVGFDRKSVIRRLNGLETANISMLGDTIPNRNATLYNGLKFASEIETYRIATVLNSQGYSVHDGTLILHDNKLYATYCRWENGTSGDAANNPTAVVMLSVFTITGERLFDKVVAKYGDTHGALSQTGGAGSPNAYIVNGHIYILYTANINNTYCEMCANYDIANDSLTYSQVLVSGSPLNNAWINSHFGMNIPTTSYTSAQSNSTIATDGTYYYIGWVCEGKFGKAIIFKTADFVNWSIFYEYSHDITPVYEMPLVYDNGYIYYASRPYAGEVGVLGKVRIADAAEVGYALFPNCSSRPLFYSWGDDIYLVTNPTDRNALQFYKIDTTDFKNCKCIADFYCPANYPSFATDEPNGYIYILRSNNSMDISKVNFTLSQPDTVQSIISNVLGV